MTKTVTVNAPTLRYVGGGRFGLWFGRRRVFAVPLELSVARRFAEISVASFTVGICW